MSGRSALSDLHACDTSISTLSQTCVSVPSFFIADAQMDRPRDSVSAERRSLHSDNAAETMSDGQAADMTASGSASLIPLPSSRTASDYQQSRHSLDDVLRFNTAGPIQALSSVSSYPSLPPSQASTQRSSLAAINAIYQPQPPLREADHTQNQAAPSDQDPHRSYRHLIRRLSTHLPHLQKVLAPTRHETASIHVLDSFAHDTVPTEPLRWHIDLRENSNAEATIEDFTRHLKDIPSALKSRVVIVEDLCPQLCCILGSVLDINPHFFAQHLLNAGHLNGKYDDVPDELWSTHDLKRDYVSIQWYRPVRPNLAFAKTGANRLQFLSQASGRDTKIASYVEQEEWRMDQHQLKPTTNIFRDEWKLSVDSEPEPSSTEPTAWLERASVWRRGSIGMLIYIFK